MERDRRKGTEQPVSSNRRKGQRRKTGTKITDATPVRREKDWDQIEGELKN